MTRSKTLALFFILTFAALMPVALSAKVRVVTTTEDLAALAREVGGSLVDAEAIAKGYRDPHFVEAKPSYLLKLKRADLFIEVGLELEVAWAPPLLTGARNRRIMPGTEGFLDASEGCRILQRSEGGDRSQGDVHPMGNPHYWLDPANGLKIAGAIAARLSAVDPLNAAAYAENLADFKARLEVKLKEWDKAAAPFKGVKAVTYHNSWPNFAEHFGIDVVDFVEPKPGVPPSPSHLSALIKRIAAEKVRVILVEPYFDAKLPEKIARESGAKFLLFAPSVGAAEGIKTYFDLFDHNIALLNFAFKGGS